MKLTFTLLAAFTLISVSVTAQKGSWYLGGSIAASSGKSKSETNGNTIHTVKGNYWGFGPEVGTFLTDHVQLGVSLNISTGKNEATNTPSPSISRSTMYGASAYSRYFFGKEAFKPFAGVSTAFSFGKQKAENGILITESTVRGFGADINAGFSYALSKRVTSVGSFGFLGYNSSTTRDDNNNKSSSSSFGLDASSIGNRFNIGFYYTL